MNSKTILKIFLSICCLVAATASASTTVQLLEGDSYNLTREVQYLIDPSHNLTLAAVQADHSWKYLDKSIVNFGFMKEAIWLKFEVRAVESNDWVLHIPYPLLDYIDNYSFINNVQLPDILSGDLRPFGQRPVNHPDFVFPYALSAKDHLTIYLRIKTAGATEIPIWIKTRDDFNKSNQIRLISLGFIKGIVIVMLLYNLFIFHAIRERAYLYYVMNLMVYLVAFSIFDGYGFQYFWPSLHNINQYNFPVFNGLVQVTSLLFMLEFLNVFKTNRWYKKYFLTLLSISITLPLLGVLLPYEIIVPLQVLFAIIMNISGLILCYYLSFKGNVSARYFSVGWTLFIIGMLCVNLKSLGLLPTNWFTENTYQLGVLIETFVLSLALAQRIKSEREKKIIAQKERLESLKHYQELYDCSLSGQFQLASNGEFLSVNPSFAKMLGYENPVEILSEPKLKLKHLKINAHQLDDIEEHMINEDIINDYELQIEGKTGKIIWIALFMRPIVNEKNKVEYYEGSTIDISERKKNEELRDNMQKDKMLTMEHLIVGICHELNTPLGIALTGLSHVKKISDDVGVLFNNDELTREKFNSFIADELELVYLAENSLLKSIYLIKLFKSLSVNQVNYHHSRALLKPIITTEIALLKKAGDNIKLLLSCDSRIIIDSYPDAVGDVIHELITNSIEHGFSENGAQIIKINITEEDNTITISYSDNGKGVEKSSGKYIFNPFYTTGRGESGKIGLGMYQVHNIITQLLKGSITLQECSQGLTYIIEFPKYIDAVKQTS